MKQNEMDMIPTLLKSGLINKKEAVNKISRFIMMNYPMFGLHKFDEDFRGDIILSFLEKGEKMVDNFKEAQGSFFTYLYCYIFSLIHTKLRDKAKEKIKEDITLSESMQSFCDKEYKYNNINFKYFESPKVPYSKININPEELKKTFENVKGDKRLLVLAIKSAYYINDNQILKICDHYNLDKKSFYNTIEYCRQLLHKKSIRKRELQERRNYAYYHHKKYEKQLLIANDDDLRKEDYVYKKKLITKDEKQYTSWKNLNTKLQNGYVLLRPSNKTTASILGICERQVTYYLNCAKKKKFENKEYDDLDKE